MDNEERKQESTRVPFTRLNQSDSDYAIAMVLQEQERAFTMLSTIESDSDEDEDEDESEASNENNDNYYGMFENHDFEDELGFLEGEESSSDYDDMEEDDIDPDELSYEELIALGEIIGVEQRGLSLNEISTCLHPCKSQSVDRKSTDRCVICQVEYEEGEELVALPCEHPYHSDCISQWLQVKKICPICSIEVSSHKIARNV